MLDIAPNANADDEVLLMVYRSLTPAQKERFDARIDEMLGEVGVFTNQLEQEVADFLAPTRPSYGK